MKTFFLLVAVVSSAQAASFLKSSWTLTNTPDAFAHDVGMSCLTAAAAHIKTEGKVISLEDDQGCSDEIHALSLVWDHSPTVPMKSINTRRRNEAQLRKAIAENFQNASPEELKILPGDSSGSKCPCMVLSGTKAIDAVNFIRKEEKSNSLLKAN
jgi:methionine-rich copper-binding protein CopC